MGNNMIIRVLAKSFNMTCELLALEICDALHSNHKEDTTLDWDISTWCDFPGVINQDEDTKWVFIETLNRFLRAASCAGKWELDSDRDDLGVEVFNKNKMTLHLVKV